jgi:membrane protease YdiL (CAAX protease family)
MNAIISFVRRQPLIAFFILAFGLTWGGGWVADTFYTGSTLSGVMVLPFLLLSPGPLLGALIVTGITGGRDGVMTLLRKFTIWRVGWRWYAVALLLTPAMFLVAIYLNVWLGAPNPSVALLAAAPGIFLAFALRLINPLDGPMKEELGWRGFALPYLQERYSTPVAYLILIALVVVWHLPLVWMGNMPAIALFGTASATILYGWIFNNTKGSVLLTLIAHATDGLFRTGMLGWTGADSSRYFTLLIAVWCVTALIVVLRYGSTMGRKPTLKAGPVVQPIAAK